MHITKKKKLLKDCAVLRPCTNYLLKTAAGPRSCNKKLEGTLLYYVMDYAFYPCLFGKKGCIRNRWQAVASEKKSVIVEYFTIKILSRNGRYQRRGTVPMSRHAIYLPVLRHGVMTRSEGAEIIQCDLFSHRRVLFVELTVVVEGSLVVTSWQPVLFQVFTWEIKWPNVREDGESRNKFSLWLHALH
jgi:hypothetical protein